MTTGAAEQGAKRGAAALSSRALTLPELSYVLPRGHRPPASVALVRRARQLGRRHAPSAAAPAPQKQTRITVPICSPEPARPRHRAEGHGSRATLPPEGFRPPANASWSAKWPGRGSLVPGVAGKRSECAGAKCLARRAACGEGSSSVTEFDLWRRPRLTRRTESGERERGSAHTCVLLIRLWNPRSHVLNPQILASQFPFALGKILISPCEGKGPE